MSLFHANPYLTDSATFSTQQMVEGGGFEPPKAEPTDLQSAPFDRSGTPPKNVKIFISLVISTQFIAKYCPDFAK